MEGNKVNGYAEHLMRKEKIPRSEYLELAHKFNPVNFNADKWVLQAKQAGMKYMVITSKHHDGFAMYNSSVSDYNVVKQTAWKHDPMADLSAACKKYGLKFGFYYSHAFDWEHPDAPGNDWDYKNPAGDLNLYGGRNWYDLHPELLEKAKKYVDEKAIPQIKELIQKYHPDILWFDTPSKLPLSENIRILKAIRETDTNVVVNGRLARSANLSMGDYINTADRPAEFFPVTGDWEAIPTTNESYGYHKFDNSHKPASFFIRLLAKAASRGGNLLMNIGPRGDGTFDPKDANILNGIGNWMGRNGESIYGSSKTPLPLQNWGVSTLKDNKLYLHVFNWPDDGRLYVGGLKSDISKAWLLTDAAKKSLPVKRSGEMDLVISVPVKAPDTVNTVLVLELKTPVMADSISYVAGNTPHVRLLAFDADLHGKGFSYGDGKADRYYVEGWKSKDQYISWKFRTVQSAAYFMTIKFILPDSSERAYQLQLDNIPVREIKIRSDRPVNKMLSDYIDKFSLSPGIHELTLKPVTTGKEELMKLLEVDLATGAEEHEKPSDVISDAAKQTTVLLQETRAIRQSKPELTSPRTLENGNLKLVNSKDWTSGFFAGELWMLSELTHNKSWADSAAYYTALLEKEQFNGGSHDVGFKVYCSYGNGYRLTKSKQYRDVIIQAAKTLSTRFNKTVGCIRSWDHHENLWKFPVIIDNMMNLELLFSATRLTGDSSFYRIAVSHADHTMKNHYRPDYSSYHVVDYDTLTGKVIKKNTHQGYADESAWARGQAWGLYGFTFCYRFTKNKKYLEQAEHIAESILHQPTMPADLVPYWDYNVPGIPNEPRDASAASILASGLYELSGYSKNGARYRATADKIMESLTNHYRSAIGESKGFILLHSTGHKPNNSEIDVPINYADYYYVEALLRKSKLSH